MKGHGSIEPEELLGDHQVRGEELLHARHWSLPSRQGSGLSDPRTQGTQVVATLRCVVLGPRIKKRNGNTLTYQVHQGLGCSDLRT